MHKNAAAFNAWVDHIQVAPVPAFCTAQVNADQTIATGTQTLINFDTRTLDPGLFWDTANKRFVAKYYSLWKFDLNTFIQSTVGDGKRVGIALRKNGTDIAWVDELMGAAATVSSFLGSGPIELNPGDYIDATINHNHGSNMTLDSDSKYTWIRCHELSH
jgi:hypothetical protein